jgi:predicted PhzF superfamily epimerase YddE/YHI9
MIEVFQVDSFTDKPFRGNPAGVCLLEEELEESVMKNIAMEMAVSETAFVSRYFAPWVGVNEDPVTGSAHCALAHYWKRKLYKTKMVAYQASERGGTISLEFSKNNRIKISGKALLTIEGKIKIA